MENQVPARIGAFEIRGLLGRGGMGVVYLAYEPALERLVALKVLAVYDESVQRRFLREARFAARVQHPHIVGIYAVGEHEGRPYIAMEYIAGETLATILLRDEPTSLGRRVQWLSELASGLAFAHRNGVVHRDVKPSNLIISRDSGLLRLLDFGIARDYDAGATSKAIVGTPQYMSPEQVIGAHVDTRSDTFAFGLVAYELLTGVHAFEGDDAIEIVTRIVEAEPVPITSHVAGVPDDLVRLVHHCLEKAPDQRPQDMTQVLATLRRIIRKLESMSDDVTIVSPLDAAAPVTPAPALQPQERALLDRMEDMKRGRELSSGFADVNALIGAGRSADALQCLEGLRASVVTPADWSRFQPLQQRFARGDDRAAQACIDGESEEVRGHAAVVARLHEVAAARRERERVEAEARARAEREAAVRAAPTAAADFADLDYTTGRPPDREGGPQATYRVLGVAAVILASALTAALYYLHATGSDDRGANTVTAPPAPGTSVGPDGETVERSKVSPAERSPVQRPVPPAVNSNAALAALVRGAAARGDVRRAASLLRGMATRDPARPALERELLQRAQRLASDARQAALARGAGKAGAFVAATTLMERADIQFARDPIGAIALYGAAQQSFAAASGPLPNVNSGPPRPEAPRPGLRAADLHPAILAQLDAFEMAYETRRVAAVRRVWPTMPQHWARSLQDSFRNLSSVDWKYGDRSVAVNGLSATVTSRVRIERRGTSRQVPVTYGTCSFDLRLRDGRWVITAVTVTR